MNRTLLKALVVMSIIGVLIFLFNQIESGRTVKSQENIKSANITPSQNSANSDLSTNRKKSTESIPKVKVKDSQLTSSEEYILSCDLETDYMFSEPVDDSLNSHEKVREAWKSSADVNANVAFLLSRDGTSEPFDVSTIIQLQNKANIASEKKLLSFHILSQCGVKENTSQCDSEVLSRAISIDEHNGAMWFLMASLAAARNDNKNTVNALQSIIAAPNYDEYWGLSIKLFDTAYESIGIKDKRRRVVAAIGSSAALVLPPVSSIFDFCKNEPKKSADIGFLCVDVGKKMVANSKTYLNKSFGYSLQQHSYTALGLEHEAEKIKKEKLDFSNNQVVAGKESELMMYDEDLFDYWYQSLLDFGESEAMIRTREEAIRKSSDPEYNPCPDLSR